MANLKTLAKETAIYGMSSIIGRFLNYLLVPLYTAKLSAESGGYGIVTNIYAITALLLVLLTYGMETGFFRFANKSEEDAQTVYSTTLLSVGSTSILFIVLCLFFLNPIASFLEYGSHPEFVAMMAIVVGMDAFQCIPFAYLRYKKRPIKFAALKLLFIFTNILMNIFFFVWAPALYKSNPELVSWFYDPSYGAGYAFLANLICTSFIMLLFIPDLISVKYKFDADLLKRMLKYSFPILILGIAGILNQTADKILYPFLVDNKAEADVQLGIYGAASKIAMIMAMFTQAFRFAYEPFVFGKSRDKDSKEMYATAMKFFIIFTLLAFLAVMFYMDILKHIIRSDYWPGLRVVPIVMAAEMFMGIYFNLSFWYKLIDETRWGAYFSIIGCSVVIILNVVFVPIYGYMACAWAGFAGYATAMILSYVVGQKKYPINYDLRRIGSYALLAIILYIPAMYIPIENMFLRLAFRTLLLCLFVTYIIKKDFPLNQIPIINRLIRK
ncbi:MULTISPECIES: lipopolysaccharide biosynthesis protein [unclassified Bacteroides]|jgi:O-antigen/teichoic acid export membrane protein|uniref:oligosaccharide flippase family protein n=1 Tax=unclassified Bacteroides TaxID=2646097 RepID=UPI000E951C4F|nr:MULTISPECIES: lipopolysaccharide biosynthesis protein [unclassified Bacteroides]RGN51253.1 lipopolysaccharide biosynthesis protein [Bacteroides sp. OM05-12]RHR78633.1 lipopolysaccharide biosynthesis protein [Bacteroides sp. AF16-49]